MKALVAEDNAKVGHFVAQIFREEGYAVDECWTGADALRLIRVARYDILVLDAALADIDGFALCRELRRQRLGAPILMVGANTNVKDRVRGLDSGADDFLVKPFAVEEFRARVHALLRRRMAFRTLRGGDLQIDRSEGSATLGGERLKLTGRELAMLAYLLERPDKVVTRMELLASIWEASFDEESKALDVHLCHLRAKLGEHRWMIETVRGRGYRLRTRQEA
jgi:DNA-binding response OmpR family regulator